MKLMLIATAFVACLTVPALAQESAEDLDRTPTSLSADLPGDVTFIDAEPLALPASLKDEPASFSIGPEGGYLRQKDADHGTWFAGAKARLHFAKILAAEASITFHSNHYENGDVTVTQYPVQLTAFLYIIPDGPIRPYILGGVGWYYTRIDYEHSLALVNKDSTNHFFGEHLGAGGELMLSPNVSIDVDVRYIFINATNEAVIHRQFNYWQIAFGLNFYF